MSEELAKYGIDNTGAYEDFQQNLINIRKKYQDIEIKKVEEAEIPQQKTKKSIVEQAFGEFDDTDRANV